MQQVPHSIQYSTPPACGEPPRSETSNIVDVERAQNPTAASPARSPARTLLQSITSFFQAVEKPIPRLRRLLLLLLLPQLAQQPTPMWLRAYCLSEHTQLLPHPCKCAVCGSIPSFSHTPFFITHPHTPASAQKSYHAPWFITPLFMPPCDMHFVARVKNITTRTERHTRGHLFESPKCTTWVVLSCVVHGRGRG